MTRFESPYLQIQSVELSERFLLPSINKAIIVCYLRIGSFKERDRSLCSE